MTNADVVVTTGPLDDSWPPAPPLRKSDAEKDEHGADSDDRWSDLPCTD
jgi:hypothetical protein